MTWFTHGFETRIERHGVGRNRKVWYTVVFLPREVASDLPFDRHPQLRIEGELADIPVKGAFIPAGDGRHYLIVAPETLKAAGIVAGDAVEVRFRVADQDAVDVPSDLLLALSLHLEAGQAWQALTPGRRRGLAVHVDAAKTVATREKRVAAVLAALAGGAATEAIDDDARRLGYLLGRRDARERKTPSGRTKSP
jgi:hypothetical protein